MIIKKRQLKLEYGSEGLIHTVNQVVSAIETLFDDYENLPVQEKYNLLSVFYVFEAEENEKIDISEIVKEFEKSHTPLDLYVDIKCFLSLLVLNLNANATNDYEDDLSQQLKYYYNTTYKQKLRSLE